MKRMIAVLLGATLLLAACQTDADVASRNLSVAAEQFEIERRVVFINGITDNYMLEITGRCSIEDQVNQLEVTCMVGEDAFKKHFLGLSDNVTYLVEQLEPIDVSVFRYRVVFKPSVIIPDVDAEFGFDTSPEEGG